ncbi:hypothetical protein ALP75_204287 [Pseudomonas syringae pv. actinidiae]|nr:hypothetical protein ALP75_204287 [Pseudomonas syringae pv. actinidiae]
MTHGVTQVALHQCQGTQQASDFIFAVDLDAVGQITCGNLLGGGHCALQRADDTAGQPQRQTNGAQRGDDHEDNDNIARFVVLGLGRLAFCIDLGDVEIGEVIELFAGAVDDLLHVDQQQLVQPGAVALACQHERAIQRRAVLAHGHQKLIIQGLFFRGVDEGLEGVQLLVQVAQTHVQLPAIGRNARRVGVQCHAQGDGPNAQHDFTDIVDHPHAWQPIGFDGHFALANGRHLRQRKPAEQCDQQGNEGKTQTGTTSDSEFA